jgi:hypothetical protein
VTKPAHRGEKSPVPVEAVEPPVGVAVVPPAAVVPPVPVVPVPVLPPTAAKLVVAVVLPPAGSLVAGVEVVPVLPPVAVVAGVVEPPTGSVFVLGLLLPQPKDPSASARRAAAPKLVAIPLVIEPSLCLKLLGAEPGTGSPSAESA